MARQIRPKLQRFIPFIGLFSLMIIFSIFAGERFWRPHNMRAIFNQTVLFMMGGLGMIFVVAQGSTDLSQGSALALIAAIAALAADRFGLVVIVPTVLFFGALIGLINGVIVSKFKVPSLTCTLAFLIAYRALITVLTQGGAIYAPYELLSLCDFKYMFPIFIGLVLFFGYLFEYTRIGYYSKAIGDNEVKARYTGIPVDRMKITAFMLSGIMAGIAGLFTLSRVGGVDTSMGNFFELEVMLALFAGGIPVTGGMGTKLYRLFIGALTMGILVNGLTLCSVSAALAEGIKGLVLISVVATTLRFTSRQQEAKA